MILGWILFSIVVGLIGSGKQIGGIPAFLISLILSPLVGFIIVLFSKSTVDVKREKELLETQKKQAELLEKIEQKAQPAEGGTKLDIAAELEKLVSMKKENLLTEDEFQQAKKKLLGTEERAKDLPE